MALSFFGGMAEGFGQSLDDHAKFVRGHRAKTRDFLQTYGTQSVLKAKDEANKVIGIGARLEALNFEPEDLTYLVDTSGPAALSTLYEKVKGFENDPSRLTPAVVKQMMQRTKDYKPSDTSYQDMVTKAFGLYAANVTDNPVENESNAFLAAMGLDPKAGGSETYLDNYTESDMRRIAGTPAPSLTSPLSVDFGALPKIYSPNAYQQLAGGAFKQIIVEAKKDFDSMPMEGATAFSNLSDKEKIERNKLKKAIADGELADMVKFSPSAQGYLLRFDATSGSSLSGNDFFTAYVPDFFSSEAAKREGPKPKTIATTALPMDINKRYSIAQINYSDIGTLESLKTYATAAEAKQSGDRYFILDGAIKQNPEVSKSNLPNLVSADLTEPTDLTEQMLSLDVPDTVKDNPILAGWQTISTKALTDLDRGQKVDVTTNRETKEEDAIALSSALDSVREYLEADAKGLSKEALEAKALEMTSKINAAPEDVQAAVMSLIQDLEDGKIPEPEQSFLSKTGEFLKGIIPQKNPEPVLGSNDPADVVAMGKIPYTELKSTQEVSDSIEFNSFDSIKNELKLGNLKDGDVVKYNANYFIVNQQGLSGAIGEVKVIGQ